MNPIKERYPSTEAKTEEKSVKKEEKPGFRPSEIHDIPQKTIHYLDPNRFFYGSIEDMLIQEHHRDWFLNQVILREYAKIADEATKEKIYLSALHAYSKASTLSKEEPSTLGIQTTPIVPPQNRYHRSVKNQLLSRVHLAFEEEVGLSYFEFVFIDSPFLAEVIAREWPQEGLPVGIDSDKAFSLLTDKLLDRALLGKYPENWIPVNFTKLYEKEGKHPKDAKQLARKLEKILAKKIDEFAKKHPNFDLMLLGNNLLSKLVLTGFAKYKGQPILLMPRFFDINSLLPSLTHKEALTNKAIHKYGDFYGDLMYMLARTGFILSPDEAKRLWLKVNDFPAILENLGLPNAKLATKGTTIPRVCKNYTDFLSQPVVKKFEDLSKHDLPYLQIYPKATVELLKGLGKVIPDKGGLDQVYKDKKIEFLLHFSYFRILNAMNDAILYKDDLIQFNNHLEIIHQEIQNILAIVEPYEKDAYSKSVMKTLSSGQHPIIPKNLEAPKVHLKPSAMHCLASVIAGAEAQKKSNHLNVAVLKSSYYHETDNSLKYAKTHHLSVLDSDILREKGLSKALVNPPAEPLDLFVCEFHHNAMLDTQVYYPEDIVSQVKVITEAGLASKKFTVAIDTTVNLEQSTDIQKFLEDPIINKMIKNGKLNVVFLRSAQKFDMLGMDNYYGGVTVTVNDNLSFASFDKRMNASEDQLKGLSYQGLTHLQCYSKTLDKYRKAIMENTQKLYKQVPQEAIFHEDTKNPMQISRIEDDRMFFLDIKFPGLPQTMDAFIDRFLKYSREELLPLTSRTSFSFINTTLTYIKGKKFRLNVGLDGSETLTRYAKFFEKVQNLFDEKKLKKKKDPDAYLAKKIEKLTF